MNNATLVNQLSTVILLWVYFSGFRVFPQTNSPAGLFSVTVTLPKYGYDINHILRTTVTHHNYLHAILIRFARDIHFERAASSMVTYDRGL